jgi:hypothetical protein
MICEQNTKTSSKNKKKTDCNADGLPVCKNKYKYLWFFFLLLDFEYSYLNSYYSIYALTAGAVFDIKFNVTIILLSASLAMPI